MIGFIPSIDIALTEYSLKGIVRTIRCVVFLEYIIVAAHIDPSGGEPCQEKTVAAQPGQITPENIVTGFVYDQEACGIRAEMRTALAQIIPATKIGIIIYN